MKCVLLAVAILLLVVMFAGCTLHLKATDVEIDSEAVKNQQEVYYELVAVGLFDGADNNR